MYNLKCTTYNWYTKGVRVRADGFRYERREDAVQSGKNLVEYFLSSWPNVEPGCSLERGGDSLYSVWGAVRDKTGRIVMRVECDICSYSGRLSADTAEEILGVDEDGRPVDRDSDQ